MPKVSICIPTYLQVDFLRRTLDSIKEQLYQDFEIIITDDSPDQTVSDLLTDFSFGDKLKYYKNTKTLGSPRNWNRAIEAAAGEYIKMLHHDDYFTYSTSLGSYVAMLENNPSADFAFSSAIAINIAANKRWEHHASYNQLNRLKRSPGFLFFGNFIGPPSSTIHRKNRLTYDTRLKWLVDLDFYVQNLMLNNFFIHTEELLITSISGASHNITNECFNNKDIEVSEYLYLFNKLSSKQVHLKCNYLRVFKNLFQKYNVNSIKDLRQAGYKDQVPFFINLLFMLKKFKAPLKGLSVLK